MTVAVELEWVGGCIGDIPHVRPRSNRFEILGPSGWEPRFVGKTGKGFLSLFNLDAKDFKVLDRTEGYLYLYIRSVFIGLDVVMGCAWLPYEERTRTSVTLREGERLSELLSPITKFDDVADFDHPVFYESLPIIRSIHDSVKATNVEMAQREQAETRAKRLLYASLSDTQRQELSELGAFRVLGQDGQTYVIYPKTHGNVYQEVDEKFVTNFCHVPLMEGLPVHDQVLAQKLLIESDLTTFLSEAIATDITPELLENQRVAREQLGVRFAEQLRQILEDRREAG